MILECIILNMILLSVFQSVEFYVIAAVVAAAIVAYSAKSGVHGPARQFLISGVLTKVDKPVSPMIELICNDDGSVLLRRYGIEGVTLSGAVSLAVTVIGFDVKIKERIVEGRPKSLKPTSVSGGYDSRIIRIDGSEESGIGCNDEEAIDTASFLLDFMAQERYFISYTSEPAGLFVAITLKNRPGNHLVKSMQ